MISKDQRLTLMHSHPQTRPRVERHSKNEDRQTQVLRKKKIKNIFQPFLCIVRYKKMIKIVFLKN